MPIHFSDSLRRYLRVLLVLIPVVVLAGCYPYYYDGHAGGYYKQGYHGSKHYRDSGSHYYHRDRWKRHYRHDRDRRHRYRHYYRH